MRQYKKLLRLDPQDVKLQLEIADAHRRWGQIGEALETYERIAGHYMDEGFDARAVAVYKQILSLAPTSHEAHTKLAELYERMGLIAEAIHALKVAAEGFNQRGQRVAALGLLRRMAILDPGNTTSRFKVANLLHQEGMEDEALAEFDGLIDDLEGQEDFEGAVGACRAALEIDGNRSSSCLALARNLIAQRMYLQAVQPARHALELDPDSAEQHEVLLQALRGAELDEELPAIYTRLAELHRRRGDEDQAREIMQRHLGPPSLDLGVEVDRGRGGEPDALNPETELTAIPQAEAELPSIPQPESELAGVLQPEAELPSIPQPESELSGVLQPESELPSIPQPESELSAIPQPESELSGVLQPESELPSILQPESELPSIPHSPEVAQAGVTPRVGESGWLPAAAGETSADLPSFRDPLTAGPGKGGEQVALPEIDLDASVAKAAALLGSGAHLQALECLETVLAVEAEHLLALENLAEVRVAMGEHDLAIETWQRASKRAREEGDEERCSAIQARISEAGGGIASGGESPDPGEPELPEPVPEAIEIVIDLEGESANEDTSEEPTLSSDTSTQATLRTSGPAPEHSEALEEADFYFHQGLSEEARAVYERILAGDPEHPVALSRLGELSGPEPNVGLRAEVTALEQDPQLGFQEISLQDPGISVDLESAAEVPTLPSLQPQELPGVEDAAPNPHGFDLDAEPAQVEEDDFSEISSRSGADDGFTTVFDAFKKGVGETLAQGDYQAHYDLGIAYKEMGLYADAIAEFRNAMPEPGRRLECLHLVGLCSMDAGDVSAAVENLEALLGEPEVQGELALSARFDLGRALVALELPDRAREAFEAVMAVDSGFRDVRAQLDALQPANPDGSEELMEEDFENFEDLFAEDFGEVLDGNEAAPEPAEPPSSVTSEDPPAAPAKTRKKKISFA